MSDLELQSLAKKVGAAKCVIFVGCYSANATSNFANVSSAHRVCVASYHCRGEHRAAFITIATLPKGCASPLLTPLPLHPRVALNS